MGQLTLVELALRQRAGAPKLEVTADLSGKTVIVVGATTGIGLEAAVHFSSMNADRVILACRNEERGQKAVEDVVKASGKKNAEPWVLDLSRFSSVVEFADKFQKEGGRVDILVLNAAIAMKRYEDIEGWESILHVNTLSTSLVALLLLPSLLNTASEFSVQTRLVVVSSETHFWASLGEVVRNSPSILKKLNDKEFCETAMEERYITTKLLNILFVRALSARLPSDSPLIVTAVNPGFCTSELGRNTPDFKPPEIELEGKKMPLTAWTAEEGARQLIYAALGPKKPEDIDKARGAYISENSIVEPSDFVISKEGKECEDRIWNETLEILGEVSPKVTEIVKRYMSA